jgi:hypothetical protein
MAFMRGARPYTPLWLSHLAQAPTCTKGHFGQLADDVCGSSVIDVDPSPQPAVDPVEGESFDPAGDVDDDGLSRGMRLRKLHMKLAQSRS